MTYNVLLVTPQVAFGELIRLTLEETSQYRVRLTQTGAAALTSTEHITYHLAILDGNLEHESLVGLGLNLRATIPGLKLMVIPPANNPRHPLLSGLEPDGYIFQPFYVPDFLDSISALMGSAASPPQGEVLPPLPPSWLDDLGRARQALQNLLPSAAAHSALLICARDAWVSAGILGQNSAQEVCTSLLRYAFSPNQSDLARFMRLNSDGSEHLVYATPIASGVLLALVYPPNAPLTKIHTQTRDAGKRLAQQLESMEITEVKPPQKEIEPEPAPLVSRPAAEQAFQTFLAELPPPEPEPEAADLPQFMFPWEVEPAHPAMVAPTPESQPLTTKLSLDEFLASLPPPDNSLPEGALPLPGNPPPEATRPMLQKPVEKTTPNLARLEETRPLLSSLIEQTRVNQTRPESTKPVPLPSIEDTQPVKVGAAQRQAPPRERGEGVHSNLAYTCLLLPRLPAYPLYGELASHLAEWLPQLCLAFGWQLEGLVIQRQYMQWSVQVQPSISPGNVIRVIRQQTSQRIYAAYSSFQMPAPGEDFWAPGYLILSGTESPSPRTVSEFIQQTRKRQGFGGMSPL